MTYDEAIDYLDSFTNYERLVSWPAQRSFRLDRMERLLDLLGRPQQKFRSLLVAGTKGKGSTCAFLYAILSQLQEPIGLYTSPHLVSVRERIRVQQGVFGVEGEDWIGEEEFARLVRDAQPAIDAVQNTPSLGGVTYFEILTALAFRHFANRRVAYAVLEVGLGGRLDATNVIAPAVSLLTPISLDHTDVLGESIRQIAAEKAGIIKLHTPLVTAVQAPEAQEAIDEAAVIQQAPVHREGRDFQTVNIRLERTRTRTDVAGWFGEYLSLHLPLLGAHQAQNASLAVAAVEILRERGLPLTPAMIRDGLRHARWPGRCEVACESPWVILDGAQNAASAEQLAQTIRTLFPETRATVILGVSQPKDVAGILRALAPVTGAVVATQAQHPRAYPASELQRCAVAASLPATTQENAGAALAMALRETGPQALIVVTGSLFLVGEARAFLHEHGAVKTDGGVACR